MCCYLFVVVDDLSFPGKLISRICDVNRSPRLPDQTAPDFFLWGYLKERVYRNNPKPLEELKENIQNEIRSIPAPMLSQVMKNIKIRMKECEARKGGHLQDIIFRK